MKRAFLVTILLFAGLFFIFRLTLRDGCDYLGFQVKQGKRCVLNNKFHANEVIRFGVYSNGIKVGSGELSYLGSKYKDSRYQQQVVFKISSLSIDDTEVITGSEDFISPIFVVRRVKLFSKIENIEEVYAKDAKSVAITKSVNNSKKESKYLESSDPMNNVLLYIYNIRNDKGLDIGKVYPVNLPTQKFELIVKDKRKIKVPLGNFEVFYIISKPSKYKFWISTSQERVPVRIQGIASGGLVYLAATAVDNQPLIP